MIEIKKSVDNQFYFVVKSSNGHVLLISEMYKSKTNVDKAIESSKKIFENIQIIDKTKMRED